jgi:hypothetical protein
MKRKKLTQDEKAWVNVTLNDLLKVIKRGNPDMSLEQLKSELCVHVQNVKHLHED